MSGSVPKLESGQLPSNPTHIIDSPEVTASGLFVLMILEFETLIVILRLIKQSNIVGTTKAHIFTPKQNQLAKLAKALGHPARIAILELLKQQACICGDIVEELGLSQSTISQHLKELKEAGLIKGEIEGPRTCYCINNTQIEQVKVDMQELLSVPKIDCDTDCC